jgi:hypothetical protein
MNNISSVKSILCYGDSNTWGYIPSSGAVKRYSREIRWTGRLQLYPKPLFLIKPTVCDTGIINILQEINFPWDGCVLMIISLLKNSKKEV